MKDLEYMTNLSDGRLNRIKELLECKGALRETEKALNEKLTQSLDQITNLEEKAAFFESLSLERAADLEKLKVDTEMLAGNFENLVDYIRRLKEELASHGHELIEGPVINLPESAQSAWIEPEVKFHCPNEEMVMDLKKIVENMTLKLSSRQEALDSLNSKI
jgi:predicted nuclease with TOPRIM domain